MMELRYDPWVEGKQARQLANMAAALGIKMDLVEVRQRSPGPYAKVFTKPGNRCRYLLPIRHAE